MVDATNSHRITSLPGYNDAKPINFDQYAGHIPLPSNGQKMFYWLVESESNPATDPLVLWLNGGPGCSSLGGFFTELGPFVVQSDLSVKRNPYAWNRKANVVFLESPAGVGFSKPQLDDNNYNDNFTMDRVVEFLKQFMDIYPVYRQRSFYVTGESYAGIYIPYLIHNLVTDPVGDINLVGFAIGNPFTDASIDGNAIMEYYYTHGMVSIENYAKVLECCPPQILWQCQLNGPKCTSKCFGAVIEATLDAETTRMDPYYIHGDICLVEDGQITALTGNSTIRPHTHRGLIGPCQSQYTEQYMRMQEVQDAIHVSGGYVEWSQCSYAIDYHRSMSAIQKYLTILQAGLKALIYSGDADSVVNFIGTQRWITQQGLNLTVQNKWKAWFGPDNQLAGYTEQYTNLTFTTIKGAGHMVPATRPLHGLYMFECFLYGDAACATFSYPKDSLEHLSGADPSSSDQLNNLSVFVFVGVLVAILILGYRRFTHHSTRKIS